jgi:hypothetical protein
MLVPVMRAIAVACAALMGMSGCSLGGDEEPHPAGGAPKAVAAVIQRFDEATRRRDFRTICEGLFTAEARRRAGGGDCERLLRSSTQDVHRPSIQIVSIRIEGRRATVRIRSRASDQRPLEDEVELVRRRARYRISALAG